MSYSVAVKFKNRKEQEKMQQFYLLNQDIINEMSSAEGIHNSIDYITLCNEKNLNYTPKKNYLLGFEGVLSRPYYITLLLAWMSVKSTYKDKSKQPFFYYDREKIKVNQKNYFSILVDEYGIQSLSTSLDILKNDKSLSFNLYLVEDFEKYFIRLNTLFNTLENRWNQFNLSISK